MVDMKHLSSLGKGGENTEYNFKNQCSRQESQVHRARKVYVFKY